MTTPVRPHLTRRDLLVAGGGAAALITASLGGCGFLSTDPQAQGNPAEQRGGADIAIKESPMLAEQVKAGDLPPLTERLPAEPMVIEVPEPGSYGGTWRSVTLGPGDNAAFDRIAGYQPLVRKNPMVTENVPNVAREVTASDDGREFTIVLREGISWSDGEPLTSDDVMFAIKDVFADTELYASPPSWISQGGKLAEAEQLDELTVKISFDRPHGLFIELLAHYTDLVALPKHYLSQFLPRHNDQAPKTAEDKGFQSWVDYFDDRTGKWTNVDLPVLDPWKITKPVGEGTAVELERNPYYWKTDQHGRQLPYIDKLSYAVTLDLEVMTLKTSNGDVDLMYRHVNLPVKKPVYAKSQESSGLRIVDNTPTSMNTMCIALNLANKNKAHAALYQKKDFRIGLSHAINREELIKAVWQRQGEPWQAAPTKDSIYYDEEFAKQYTEYDLDLANQHLDKAGITERDDDGYRRLPNGKPLVITMDIAAATFGEWPAAADMISRMWKEVGVRMKVNSIDRTLFSERVSAESNETDACAWSGDGGLAIEIVEPRWYFPFSSQSFWATPWAEWFATNRTAGAEPIAPIKQQMELYWKLQETPAQADREELFGQILAIAKEQFWVIGIGSAPNPYMVVKDRLKNVTGGLPDNAVYYTPAHSNPDSWFIDEEA